MNIIMVCWVRYEALSHVVIKEVPSYPFNNMGIFDFTFYNFTNIYKRFTFKGTVSDFTWNKSKLTYYLHINLQ